MAPPPPSKMSVRRRPSGGLGGLMGSMFSPLAMSPLSDVDYEMQRVMNGTYTVILPSPLLSHEY